jgi:hypothetical protein
VMKAMMRRSAPPLGQTSGRGIEAGVALELAERTEC